MWKKNFKIDDSLYPELIIQQAIIDFSDYDIIYTEKQLLIAWENEKEQDELFYEFMNYSVALYNETL